uniref:Uncharacterized protein n=1 Tax=Arundo donax TaxID=35708 RepID=A0A0A8YYD8_ARUDO
MLFFCLFQQDEVRRCLPACCPCWQPQPVRGGFDSYSGVRTWASVCSTECNLLFDHQCQALCRKLASDVGVLALFLSLCWKTTENYVCLLRCSDMW